jgi:hypothetical protein
MEIASGRFRTAEDAARYAIIIPLNEALRIIDKEPIFTLGQ